MISSPFFPSGTLPGLPRASYYPADVSNLREIASAAQDVINACVGSAVEPPEQCAGYVLIGGRRSIGVFIWGTFSKINFYVGPAVNGVGVNGTVEVSGNGTVVGEEFLMGPGESGKLVETS